MATKHPTVDGVCRIDVEWLTHFDLQVSWERYSAIAESRKKPRYTTFPRKTLRMNGAIFVDQKLDIMSAQQWMLCSNGNRVGKILQLSPSTNDDIVGPPHASKGKSAYTFIATLEEIPMITSRGTLIWPSQVDDGVENSIHPPGIIESMKAEVTKIKSSFSRNQKKNKEELGRLFEQSMREEEILKAGEVLTKVIGDDLVGNEEDSDVVEVDVE